MAAYKSEVHLDRQDVMLMFGATNNITSAATYPCGYAAGATDGTYLDLGNTDLEGMSVIFHCDTDFDGTNATFKVSVSDDKSTWKEIAASPAIVAANLKEGKEYAVAIPRGHEQGQFMKATVTTTGTATKGKVSAYVDTYIGK